jgi:transcriptional regulator with XRE-family HTH domain
MNGRTQAWLAERIGVATSSINGYLKGIVPQADVCLRMCDALAVDVRWYLTGEADERERGSEGVLQVALLDYPDRALTYPTSHIEAFGVAYDSLCCVFVTGTMMAPAIPMRSEVLGTRDFGEVEDGRVYIVRTGQRHVVRRLSVKAAGKLVAVCDNPAAVSEAADEIEREDVVALVLWAAHAP